MAESSPVGLAWLDALEGEFDRVFRELHLGLGALPPVYEEDSANLGGRVGAMASVFSQLVCKTKAVFQTNCKLEVSWHLSFRLHPSCFHMRSLAMSFIILVLMSPT